MDTCLTARCKRCNRLIFATSVKPKVIRDHQEELIELILAGHDLIHAPSRVVLEEFWCGCETTPTAQEGGGISHERVGDLHSGLGGVGGTSAWLANCGDCS